MCPYSVIGNRFRQFLSFNLERKEDRNLFDRDQPFDTLVKALLFSRNASVAGSLLEVMIDTYRSSFPVGRVEFAYMFPPTFREFLVATGESAAVEAFCTVPLPDCAHAALQRLFHTYVLLGGMPEVIQHHVERDDLSELSFGFLGMP